VDVPSTVAVIGGVVAIMATIVAVGRWVVRSVSRLVDRWENVQVDLYGEPARPGRTAIPGGLERLGKVEADLRDTVLRVGSLETFRAEVERWRAHLDGAR
jgi:hypothetical protein